VGAARDGDGLPPGERYYYSNVGFRVLGCALEEVTGVPYQDLLRTRVLEPLGLSSSEPAITTEIRDRLAVGYDRLHDDRPISPDDPLYPAPWFETGTADGSLAATAGDLATFVRFLLEEGADSLVAQPRIDSGDGWSYGYGLEVRTEGGRRALHARRLHAGVRINDARRLRRGSRGSGATELP
jgi:CubicO group peptidase (beta-lactamase class C family)